MNGLSIIITTYKRTFSLKLLIKEIEKQKINSPLEVIVVNNNLKKIKITSKKIDLKIINNFNKNGCSSRYKIAKENSKYKTIVFLDDDVKILSSLFLQKFKNFFDKKNTNDIVSSWCSILNPHQLDYFSAKPINFNNTNQEKEVDLIGPGISILNKKILTNDITNLPEKFEGADNVWFSLQTSIIHKSKKYYFPSKDLIKFRLSYLNFSAMYRKDKVKNQKDSAVDYFLNKGYLPLFTKNLPKIKTPIALISYNRSEILEKNLKYFSYFSTGKIYAICDGPKSKDDERKTNEVRKLISKYIPKEKFIKIYATKNMGLRNRVVSGLNKVFEKEETAIILEDDCIPDPSFFKYCDELLIKYKNNPKIGSISGSNFIFGQENIKNSYYFSQFTHSWGWATWRRAWNKYDDEMKNWENILKKRKFSSLISKAYWHLIFLTIYKQKINSWAFRWTLSCWKNNMITIMPKTNLVKNIGVGKLATNTKIKSKSLEINTVSLNFPLKHPTKVEVNNKLDNITEKNVYLKPKVIIGAFLKLLGVI